MISKKQIMARYDKAINLLNETELKFNMKPELYNIRWQMLNIYLANKFKDYKYGASEELIQQANEICEDYEL